MTDYFVFRAFDLVTPFMNGKGFTGKPREADNHDFDNLSVCGHSMYDLMNNMAYNPTRVEMFSTATLQKVVRHYHRDEMPPSKFQPERTTEQITYHHAWTQACINGTPAPEMPKELEALEEQQDAQAEKAFEAALNDRKALEELARDVLNNEIQDGNYSPKDYPIHSLLHGVFINHNWLLLGEDDFWAIAACHGAKKFAPEEHDSPEDGTSRVPSLLKTADITKYTAHSRDTALCQILNTQNFLATELILQGHEADFEVRSVEQLAPLLQDALHTTYLKPEPQPDHQPTSILQTPVQQVSTPKLPVPTESLPVKLPSLPPLTGCSSW